jgi:hypothetical protein
MWKGLAAGLRRWPVLPAMFTYSLLYPGANLLQQKYFRYLQQSRFSYLYCEQNLDRNKLGNSLGFACKL